METIFLVCFLFGAIFTAASFVLGFAGSALHVDHGGAEIGHAGLAHAGHVDGLHADVAHIHHDAGHHASGGGGFHSIAALLNVGSVLAFLTWFGAAGYVLSNFAGLPGLVAFLPAVAVGAAGGMLVSFTMARLRAGERVMNPDDYRLVGTIGRVTVGIPAGGVGEIIFSKAGGRRSEAARSADVRPIGHDTEVVVMAYERGIAVVRPWSEVVSDDA